MSLKELIKNYLEKNKIATRDELRQYGWDNYTGKKYDISTVDRKLRELTNKNIITPMAGTKRFNGQYAIIEPKTSERRQILPNSAYSADQQQLFKPRRII